MALTAPSAFEHLPEVQITCYKSGFWQELGLGCLQGLSCSRRHSGRARVLSQPWVNVPLKLASNHGSWHQQVQQYCDLEILATAKLPPVQRIYMYICANTSPVKQPSFCQRTSHTAGPTRTLAVACDGSCVCQQVGRMLSTRAHIIANVGPT